MRDGVLTVTPAINQQTPEIAEFRVELLLIPQQVFDHGGDRPVVAVLLDQKRTRVPLLEEMKPGLACPDDDLAYHRPRRNREWFLEKFTLAQLDQPQVAVLIAVAQGRQLRGTLSHARLNLLERCDDSFLVAVRRLFRFRHGVVLLRDVRSAVSPNLAIGALQSGPHDRGDSTATGTTPSTDSTLALAYDPAVSPTLTIGVDARALVPEATGIGVYCRAILQGLAADPGVAPVAMAHAPLSGLGDIDIEHTITPSSSGVLWQQFRFNRQLGERGCDLLWSPIFTLPRWPQIPAVVTVHDLTAWYFPRAHRLKVRASLKPFIGPSLKAATAIITPSMATAHDLADRFPEAEGKTSVIPHGVDPEFSPADESAIAAIRNRLGLQDGYIVYSGTIEPRKNLDCLIEVWAELRRRDQAPPLVVVGGRGWKSNRTLTRMRELEPLGLHYLGRLDRRQQVEVIQAATVMVFASLYEGFGLPALEAMACAVPVISSDRSSLPEVVDDAGLLVDPEDRAQLAQAIRTLVSDSPRARELGMAGYTRSKTFTWERSVAQHIDVFHSAFASGGS